LIKTVYLTNNAHDIAYSVIISQFSGLDVQ